MTLDFFYKLTAQFCLTGFHFYSMEFVLQGGEKGATDSWPYIILSNLNRFIKIFTTRFLGKFAIKWILNFPPHLAYVPTLGLPREKLMSAKQVINDKLQGSVAAYLRCCGVVNNQIKKGLLLSLWVKKIKIGEYLAKLPTKTWLSRALSSSFSSVLARRTKCKVRRDS